MKTRVRGFALVLVITAVLMSAVSPAFAADAMPENALRFREDGSFRILQITDTQDTQWPSPNMLSLIHRSLDASKPDLVVFTGDQLKNYDSDFEGPGVRWKVEKALGAIIKPVVARDIPFAVAFGNHDSWLDVTLEEQVVMMQKYKGCLVVDEGPDISGCGNYNIPIYSSDGSAMAFNLFFLDSNQSVVMQDQIDWYIAKSNELTALNGGVPIPSFEFQHIIPYNYELVSAFAAQGDVFASFFGHNHYASHNAPWLGIDRWFTPTAGFYEFGPDMERGVRVIDIYENDPYAYDTFVLTYIGLFGDNPITHLRYRLFTLGGLDGNPMTVITEVLSGVAQSLIYVRDITEGDPVRFISVLLEFFGVDIGRYGLSY